MLSHSEAFWLQFTTIIIAFIGPVIAVLITLWYQNRQSRRSAQMQLFMEIVSFRDFLPLPWQYIVALNRIDIVFHKQPNICQIWHKYYELAHQDQVGNVPTLLKEKKVELITAIAHHLGYPKVDQIFLNRYYQTQHSADQYWNEVLLREAQLKYYQVGHEWMELALAGAKAASENQESPEKSGQLNG